MEKIILNIKDSSKLSFLIQLIKQLDFVEVEKTNNRKFMPEYDFFSSAGLWENRDIKAMELRKEAWQRKK
jgi:hypothetical protein